MIGRQFWLLFSRRDWRGDASAYLDDELTPRQRNQFEARLARSDEMQEYLDDLRQMRTALRGYAAESARAPFQITPEMLASHTAAPLRASGIERALRLSMTTAAVGVATFTAVLIFDAVDRPTVTFTTTSAGDTRADAPAAQVAVERASVQESAADAGGSAVAVASIASTESQQGQQAAAPAREAEATEPAGQATVSAYDAEQDSQVELAQAVQEQEQELEQAQAQQQAAQESEWQQSAQAQAESAQAAAHEQAAADPSRRALNAGSANREANEQEVSAADVVASQEEEQPAQASVSAVPAQEEESPAIESAGASDSQESAESTDSTESGETGDGAGETAGGQAAADSATASTAPVTSSVRVVESEWPLPQRPQSSSVQLATDPSWEAPLQIALAVVAFGSLLAWLLLTVVDRRRQT